MGKSEKVRHRHRSQKTLYGKPGILSNLKIIFKIEVVK